MLNYAENMLKICLNSKDFIFLLRKEKKKKTDQKFQFYHKWRGTWSKDAASSQFLPVEALSWLSEDTLFLGARAPAQLQPGWPQSFLHFGGKTQF